MNNLENIIYQGGKNNGIGGAVYPNVNTVFIGHKGQEIAYKRTGETDLKGRHIFKAAESTNHPVTTLVKINK